VLAKKKEEEAEAVEGWVVRSGGEGAGASLIDGLAPMVAAVPRVRGGDCHGSGATAGHRGGWGG
jgi:hypothetical protein